MKEEIPLLDFLKSTKFILYVSMFTVLFLAPNTYYVFHKLSVFTSPYREIASAGVALIVASAIMIYTLRKNFEVARYYSIFEVLISGYYYIDMLGLSWDLVPAMGFTLMLPVSVFYATKEIDASPKFTQKEMDEYLEANRYHRPSDFFDKKP
jgi:hypothetical protein